jgi:tripartite-type tricarboxylate transporter receptor subunit TctC
MAEAGLTAIDISSWYAIMAPAKTDPQVVKALADEVKRIVALPDVKATLDAQGLTPVAMPPAELGAYIKKETAVWAKVIREANIQAE